VVDSQDDPLALYASGRIGDDERRRLCAAALEDQGVFDALALEDAVRDVLNEPDVRRRLLELLEATPRRSKVATSWLRPLALAASLTAVALTATLLWRQSPGSAAQDLLSLTAAPTEQVASLWREIDEAPTSKSLDAPTPKLDLGRAGNPPQFRAGEIMSLALSADEDADVLLLVLPPSGAPRALQRRDTELALRLEAGARYPLAGPGQPVVAPSEAGLYRLRLLAVAATPNAPVSIAGVAEGFAAGVAGIVEVVFEVTTR
jgi:hypothetical protein